VRAVAQEAAVTAQGVLAKGSDQLGELLERLYAELGVTQTDEYGTPKLEQVSWSPSALMIHGLLSSFARLLEQARVTFGYCREAREAAFLATPEGRAMVATEEQSRDLGLASSPSEWMTAVGSQHAAAQSEME